MMYSRGQIMVKLVRDQRNTDRPIEEKEDAVAETGLWIFSFVRLSTGLAEKLISLILYLGGIQHHVT